MFNQDFRDVLDLQRNAQQQRMISLMEEEKARQDAIRKEKIRRQKLPKCPYCKSPVETGATTCTGCQKSLLLTDLFGVIAQGRQVILRESPKIFFNQMEKSFFEAQTKIIRKPIEILEGAPSLVSLIIEASGPNSPIQGDLKKNNYLKEPDLTGKEKANGCVFTFFLTLVLALVFPLYSLFGPHEYALIFSIGSEEIWAIALSLPFIVPFLIGFFYVFKKIKLSSGHAVKRMKINQQLPMKLEEIADSLKSIESGCGVLQTNTKVLEKERLYLQKLANQFNIRFNPTIQRIPENIWFKYRLGKKLPSSSDTREWFQTSKDLPKELEKIASSIDAALLNPNSGNTNNEPVEDITSEKESYFIKLPNNKVKGPYSKSKITESIKQNKIPSGCFVSQLKTGPWKELPTG